MTVNLKPLLDPILLHSIYNPNNTHLFKVVFIKTLNILCQFYLNPILKLSDLKVKEKTLEKFSSLNPNTPVKSPNHKFKAIFLLLTRLTIITFPNKPTLQINSKGEFNLHLNK